MKQTPIGRFSISLEAGPLVGSLGGFGVVCALMLAQAHARGQATHQGGRPHRLFEHHDVVDRRRQAGFQRGMGFGVAAQQNERDGTAGWQPLERGADLIQWPRCQLVGEYHHLYRRVEPLCQARLVGAVADVVALDRQPRGELAPFRTVAHAEKDAFCFRSFVCHVGPAPRLVGCPISLIGRTRLDAAGHVGQRENRSRPWGGLLASESVPGHGVIARTRTAWYR